jgi:hypothetical protein
VRGERLGSLIGAVGGLVFIVVNAGGVDSPTGLVVRIVGVVAFLAVVWLSVFRPSARAGSVGPAPTAKAMRVYWICVTAEVVGFFVGNQVLVRVFDRPDLVVVWVVLVVGAHFVPFAAAFHAPTFLVLGWTMIGLAVVGGVLTVVVDPVLAPWTAILAGAVLLGFAATSGLRRRVAISDR